MKRPLSAVLFTIFAPIALAALALAPLTAEAAPPTVVKTTPPNGETSVNPKRVELRITFDQDMRPDSYSLCGGGPSFPEVTGKPKWDGPRTIIVPVKLKPDHDYVFGVNSETNKGFKNTDGEPATPYKVTFRTRSDVTLSREDNRKAIAKLQKLIHDAYSYRDLQNVDWKKAFADANSTLEESKSPGDFARAAAGVLKAARDIHIVLKVNDSVIGTYRANAVANLNVKTLTKAVKNFKKVNDTVYTGTLKDGIGYILIDSWGPKDPDDLRAAYDMLKKFKDAPGVVLDMRSNGGGNELLAREFAGCFVTREAVYSRHATRDPKAFGGFSKPVDRTVVPSKDHPHFEGKVAVLMGGANMSSCESFLLMMKQAKTVRLFGMKSYGSSGNPKTYELGNGVSVNLPSWKDLLPDGTLLEGRGVEPDVEVRATPDELAKSDAVLEAGRKWIAEKR